MTPKISKQIRHSHWAQLLDWAHSLATNCSQLLLKLTGRVGIHCQVARIMRSRRKLVNEHAAIPREEELDAEDALNVQAPHDRLCYFPSLGCLLGTPSGRRTRKIEDVIPMDVPDRVIASDGTARVAGRDNREFTINVDELLKHRSAARKRLPDASGITFQVNEDLPFAVVPRFRRLQHTRTGEFLAR